MYDERQIVQPQVQAQIQAQPQPQVQQQQQPQQQSLPQQQNKSLPYNLQQGNPSYKPQPVQQLGSVQPQSTQPKLSRWNQKGEGEASFNYNNNGKDTKINRGLTNVSENIKIEEIRPGQLVDIIRFHNQRQSQNRIPVRAYQEQNSQELINLLFNIHLQKKSDKHYQSKLEDLKSSVQKDIDHEKHYIQKEKDKQKRLDEQAEILSRDFREEDLEYSNQAYGKTYDKRSQIQINESRLRERLEENKIGLGALNQQQQPMSQEDIYSKFRQSRSVQYHVTAEERHYTRDRSDRCYKCNQPGHIARDCQFGLT